MINPFDFFERIECVNLVSRPDRWAESLIEFEKVGIKDKVKRFDGIICNENSVMKGRAGCFSSFREIIRRAKEDRLENVLIFEDDVKFITGDPLFHLQNSLTDLDGMGWQMFYLGCNPEAHEKLLKTKSPNLVKITGALCLHATAYHSSIYDIILNEIPTLDKIIPWLWQNESMDGWIMRHIHPNYNCYSTNPMIATQRPSWSNIDNKYVDFGQNILQNFNNHLEQ